MQETLRDMCYKQRIASHRDGCVLWFSAGLWSSGDGGHNNPASLLNFPSNDHFFFDITKQLLPVNASKQHSSRIPAPNVDISLEKIKDK